MAKTPEIVAVKIAQQYFTLGAHDKITKHYSKEVADHVWKISQDMSKILKARLETLIETEKTNE